MDTVAGHGMHTTDSEYLGTEQLLGHRTPKKKKTFEAQWLLHVPPGLINNEIRTFNQPHGINY